MKTFQNISMLMVCIILAATAFTSCEWDTSPEPDHPLYVTYTITASNIDFSGPEQLLPDMRAWIKANQIIYDKPVSYSTGEASEFTKTDAEAIKKYEEEFLPKFKAYLEEVKGKLKSGDYGAGAVVNATFYTAATRTQGKDGNLKYEQFTLAYPSATE
jgi:hypothetical protein